MTAAAAVPPIDAGASRQDVFVLSVRLGDNALILGQRLAEWSSKAPSLELDIALANQALDLFGQARMFYDNASRIEGRGRSEDDLAFLRDVLEFRNVLMVELPRGDFAFTVVRQFLFASFSRLLYEELTVSADPGIAAIAAKAIKEIGYHVRHNGEWMVRLGDGTEESKARAQAALDALWPYTGELFERDEVDIAVAAAGIAPDPQSLRGRWLEAVAPAIERATLATPPDGRMHSGGRHGRHSEHLGYILAEMQFLQRSYPGARW